MQTVISLILLAAIRFVRLGQLQVVMNKISLATMGGVTGDWIDYTVFFSESCL